MQSISILNGNLFSCGFDREALPPNDPLYVSYACSIDTLVQFLAITGAILLIFCGIVMWLTWERQLKIYESIKQLLIIHIKEWNAVIQSAYQELHKMKVKFRTSIGSSNDHVFAATSMLLTNIRHAVFWFSVIAVCILSPTYRILNISESMYENKYIWEFSAIYMTGTIPGRCCAIDNISVCHSCYILVTSLLEHSFEE